MTGYDGERLDEVKLDNDAVRNATVRMERFNKRARCVEVALVGLLTAGVLFLVGGDLADRRAARERNAEAQRDAAEAQRFGTDAVQCIVGQLVDHRIADRAFFEDLLAAHGIDFDESLPDAVADDPLVPAGDPLRSACERFQSAVDHGGPTTSTTRRKP
jgi:hypothetical protein